MTKKAFDKIAAGLEAAIEYAKGRADLSTYRVHLPPVDVAALRARLDLSSAQFASQFGFELTEVQAWETGLRPQGAVQAYLLVIERDPDAVVRALTRREQTAA